MNNLVDFDYVNKKDKKLVDIFISSANTKRYILGINKFTKAISKLIDVDGIIDDFTRVHSSKKKNILQIEDVPKDALILSTASGSPLEVKNRLNEMGFINFNYLALYKYSSLNLPNPPFIMDFEDDFKQNRDKYSEVYDLLEDKKSKEIFEKVINFKISFDYNFMDGFTNDHEGQYFDKDIVPEIKNITFLDGGGYIGDTLPTIMKNYPDFKKIYMVEPSVLHMNIAKKSFGDIKNIEFINCGISNKKVTLNISGDQNSCDHNYQAQNLDTIDNIINGVTPHERGQKIDFIKLDIEGAEQDAIDGAIGTIKRDKPVLAICIYHKAEDWYKIPQKVLAINSEYKIYLRHYMEGIY
ncbi:MAG: FkbM family methyltransferase, partial [Campylobacterota bacterium]|nr:FkbM family methyltransferase [Campylobacterota bacterium]